MCGLGPVTSLFALWFLHLQKWKERNTQFIGQQKDDRMGTVEGAWWRQTWWLCKNLTVSRKQTNSHTPHTIAHSFPVLGGCFCFFAWPASIFLSRRWSFFADPSGSTGPSPGSDNSAGEGLGSLFWRFQQDCLLWRPSCAPQGLLTYVLEEEGLNW